MKYLQLKTGKPIILSRPVSCQPTMWERPCRHIMWHRKFCVAIYSQLFLFCLEEIKKKTACLEPKSLFKSRSYFCRKWRIWTGRWNIVNGVTPEIYLQSLWEGYLWILTVTNVATLRNWSLYVQNVIVWICDMCVWVRACVICIKGLLYSGM
jgi:hypothetical protein